MGITTITNSIHSITVHYRNSPLSETKFETMQNTRINDNGVPQTQPAHFRTFRSEEEYPSLCVCCESSTDCCNCFKNFCCPCLGTKEIALHVGETNDCAWGWCLGVYCCAPYGQCAHGAVLTQKLRKKHGFEENRCCDVCTHWCCLSCALTQEQHLIEHDSTPAGPPRQAMGPVRMKM